MSRFLNWGKKKLVAAALKLAPSIEPSLQVRDWVRAGCQMPAPWTVKMQVLERYMIPGAAWIETGTYLGETTAFLAERAPRVLSLEPDLTLYLGAVTRFSHSNNINILNKTSEDGLSEAFDFIQSRKICLWLDGHYSGGSTFAGPEDTPILHEIGFISDKIKDGSLDEVAVFIDDVRLFASRHKEVPGAPDRGGYPPLVAIVGWAEEIGLDWLVEHDIFIARTRPSL